MYFLRELIDILLVGKISLPLRDASDVRTPQKPRPWKLLEVTRNTSATRVSY